VAALAQIPEPEGSKIAEIPASIVNSKAPGSGAMVLLSLLVKSLGTVMSGVPLLIRHGE
jgi:hypothetical protein